MVERIRKARRVAALAAGVVKAIFRTGRAWGTARTRAKTARRPAPRAAGPGLAAGAVAGAAGAYFLDPESGKRRRHVAFGRARALVGKGSTESEHQAGDGAAPAKEPKRAPASPAAGKR